LQEGDLIVLGGSSTIKFQQRSAEAAPPPGATPQAAVQHDMSAAAAVNSVPTAVSTPAPPAAKSSPPLLLIAGIGVVAIAVIAGIGLYAAGVIGGGCQPTAKIVNPQSGSVVRGGGVKVRVETENAKCIERVIYQLDGSDIARAEAAPYDVTLGPNDMQGVAPGNHILTVVVEDQSGKKKLQPDEVLLALEPSSTVQTVPTPSDTTGTNNNPTGETPISNTTPPLNTTGGIDVPGLARNFATQVSRKSGYVIDAEFAEASRARTNEYRINGVTDRARRSRRFVNKAFRDKGLEPVLGYVLALSRSKYNEGATGEGVGLWQVPPAIAQSYLSPSETPAVALADPQRSAEIAATYFKALIDTFEMDDFMYAVACYGMSISQAGEVRTKLMSVAPDPVARRDFWKMVKSGVIARDQADRVVRFFAAGVVGENPQQFALTGEQPFSSLY
jgi:hypothetical protein